MEHILIEVIQGHMQKLQKKNGESVELSNKKPSEKSHRSVMPFKYCLQLYCAYLLHILLFSLQFYKSEAWFELNKEQINAARTVQVFIYFFNFFKETDIFYAVANNRMIELY